MHQNWQGLRPRVVPLAGSMFNVFPSSPALGQQDAADYVARAQAAIAQYDDLLKRIANIGDKATQNDLLSWISRADVPGTPAERRKIVGEDLVNPPLAANSYTGMKRVGDLEEMNKLLDAKVKKAEASFPSISNPNAPGQIKLNNVFTPTGIALGAVSILGLLVVPFMLKGNR